MHVDVIEKNTLLDPWLLNVTSDVLLCYSFIAFYDTGGGTSYRQYGLRYMVKLLRRWIKGFWRLVYGCFHTSAI